MKSPFSRVVWLVAVVGCSAPTPPDSGVQLEEDGGTLGGGAGGGGGGGGELDAGTEPFDAGPGALLAVCGTPAGPGPSYAALDLGHGAEVACIQTSGSTALTIDTSGRWLLWNRATHARLAQGALTRASSRGGCETFAAALRGDTLALTTGGNLELRAAHSGALLSTRPAGTRADLALDGSYAWVIDATGLTTFAPDGTPLVALAGDFASANVFAHAQQLLFVQGSTLERVAMPAGTRTTVGAVSGTFSRWFDDGSHFFTRLGATVWLYASDARLVAVLDLPDQSPLGGRGNWYWQTRTTTLPLFAVDGGATPVRTFPVPTLGAFALSGDAFVSVPYGTPAFELAALAGGPALSFTTPTPYLSAIAFADDGEFVVGAQNGAVWTGFADGGAAALGCGSALSIAGSATGRVAIATAVGQVLLLDLEADGGRTLLPPVERYSSHVELTSDGARLVVAGSLTDAQYWDDRSVQLYEVSPRGLLTDWVYRWASYPTVFIDYAFAPESGRSQHLVNSNGSYTSRLFEADGGLVATTNAGALPLLSPDGVHAALNSGTASEQSTTQLFTNGALSGAMPGRAVGWLGNDLLVVNVYRGLGPSTVRFDHTELRDAAGVLVRTLALPELGAVVAWGPDELFDTRSATAWDLTTQQPVWTSAVLGGPVLGALAGAHFVSRRGPLVFIEPRR